MPLTRQQKQNFFLLAKERWLEAEGRLLAYERRFRKQERLSGYLSYVSIAAAIIAAIAAQFPHATWIATVGALVTAILTGADRVLSPAADADRYWKSRTAIDEVKRDLATAAIQIEEATDLSSGAQPFNDIAKRIALVTTPFEVLEHDKLQAQESFNGTVISNLLHPSEPPLSDDAPSEIASDTPGFISVSASIS